MTTSSGKNESLRLPELNEDWQIAEDTFTPEAIHAQAKLLLNRALGTHRLIAFVGSGVSAAYGRISWGELATLQRKRITALFEPAGATLSARQTSLIAQLKDLAPDAKPIPGDRIILALTLCEQVWSLTPIEARNDSKQVILADLAEAFSVRDLLQLRLDSAATLSSAELGRELFRAWIKRETHDEIPHVLRVLAGGEDGIEKALTDAALDAPAGVAEVLRSMGSNRPLRRTAVEQNQRIYASLFDTSLDAVSAWRRAIVRRIGPLSRPRPAISVRVDVFSAAKRMLREIEGLAMSPTRYFVFGLLLDLLRISAPNEFAGAQPARALARCLRDVLKFRSPHSRKALSRAQLIPPDGDPLHLLVYRLDVSRFATTNYDLEIERLAHDMGFRSAVPLMGTVASDPVAVRMGSVGALSRDFVMSDETVVDLLDFATNENMFTLEVVHLHGRANLDEEVIVTERDYQRTYVRNDDFAKDFGEAREVTFGGNPILFIGFGMSESDVLRPLREFVTGRSRRNRAVIALLPAEKGSASRSSFAMEQFIKYGVSVMYFGESADRKFEFEDAAGRTESDSSWFRWLMEILGRVQKAVTCAGEARVLPAAAPASFSILRDEVEKCRRALPDFKCGRERCDITFELDFVLRLLDLCTTALDRSPRTIDDESCLKQLLKSAAPSAVERITVAIRTAALCAALRAIQKDHASVVRAWPTSVRNRAEFAHFAYLKEDHWPGPIWARHRVYEGEQPIPAPASWDTGCLPKKVHPGRRCLVITSSKGVGKGHLYSYLTETTQNSAAQGIPYLGQFFTTFGCACEIASIWDTLPLFLLSPEYFPALGEAFEPGQRHIWKDIEDTTGIDAQTFAKWSRKTRLDAALRAAAIRLAKAGRGARGPTAPRLLVAFNVFDVLFDDQGCEKQAEIREIFDILLGEEHADIPLDIFFVVRDSHLPIWFRDQGARDAAGRGALKLEPPQLLLASSQQTDPSLTESVIRTLKRGRANIVALAQALSAAQFTERVTKDAEACDGPNFIYVLPPLDPLRFGCENSEGLHRILQRALLPEGVRDQDHANQAVAEFFQRNLASSRFGYALVMSIARHLWTQHRAGAADDEGAVAEKFREVVDGIRRAPVGLSVSISDRFFEVILDYWFNHGQPGEDPMLNELILRHLAVIGMPVTARVLARCPRIRDRLGPDRPGDPDQEKRHIERVWSVLKILESRCLILKLDGARIREPPHENSRYQLHRGLQVHVYRRLGSPRSEPLDGNIFGPSLYAAQTRGHPRLKAAAYAFLDELVDELTLYEKLRGGPERAHVSAEELPAMAEALRCALGVVRTLFSIAVVTRFADVDGLPHRNVSQMGYFEHHRLVLYWMIKLGSWIDEQVRERRADVPPPFYRDELVWLHNECGVFSLAQGKCYDAKALFERALLLQARIEGSAGGPMRRRILLNEGISAIDRGRLSDARLSLEEIERSESEDTVLHATARGFLGVVDYLSGELNSAQTRLKEAIARLEQHHRLRPVAMLKLHLAFLRLHEADHPEAERIFNEALQIAESGGFSDLLHYARLGAIKARLRNPGARSSPAMDGFARYLEDAETYSDRMDIPRLKVDVLLLRGEMLILQKETTLSGQLITHGLRIANLNGLVLRRIFAMEFLAHIYRMRGHKEACDRLLGYAQRSARHLGYHLSVIRTGSSQMR